MSLSRQQNPINQSWKKKQQPWPLCTNRTWLKLDDMLTTHQICPIGYKAISILRTGRTGRGRALVHRTDNIIKLDKNYTKSNMEGATFMYHCPSYTNHLTVVYRPPDTRAVQFISNSTEVVEEYVNWHGHHTILGNFKIQINDENDSDTINFNNFLNNLTSQMKSSSLPTSNTTTLTIIAPNMSNYIQNVKQGELFSDHYMIFFHIMEPTNIWKFNTAAYHKTKAINK